MDIRKSNQLKSVKLLSKHKNKFMIGYIYCFNDALKNKDNFKQSLKFFI